MIIQDGHIRGNWNSVSEFSVGNSEIFYTVFAKFCKTKIIPKIIKEKKLRAYISTLYRIKYGVMVPLFYWYWYYKIE